MPRKKSDSPLETPQQQAALMLDQYIDTHGMRHTAERRQVLATVLATEGRFTIDDIATTAAQSTINVCRSTVVNTMRLLLKLGIVLRVGQHGRFSAYQKAPREPRKSASTRVPIGITLQCTRCGTVREVRDRQATAPLASRRYKSFVPASGVATIFGLCGKCKAQQTSENQTKQ